MGKLINRLIAGGNGWAINDVVCTAGPQDRPFEEQHNAFTIAVVVAGSFQYRSSYGSEIMSPGSLLLDNYGQYFECGHEHGTGDRCVSFQYGPDFFERAGVPAMFQFHRIPPIAALTPWVVRAGRAIQEPQSEVFEELAQALAGAVLPLATNVGKSERSPTAADERRISRVVRFVDANLGEPLTLERLAGIARMSDFHFLRVFREVMGVTPHQYILRARLRQAALRLKTGGDAVVEIALDAGFRDVSNFNHAFRAEFGMNPARFRGRFL